MQNGLCKTDQQRWKTLGTFERNRKWNFKRIDFGIVTQREKDGGRAEVGINWRKIQGIYIQYEAFLDAQPKKASHAKNWLLETTGDLLMYCTLSCFITKTQFYFHLFCRLNFLLFRWTGSWSQAKSLSTKVSRRGSNRANGSGLTPAMRIVKNENILFIMFGMLCFLWLVQLWWSYVNETSFDVVLCRFSQWNRLLYRPTNFAPLWNGIND